MIQSEYSIYNCANSLKKIKSLFTRIPSQPLKITTFQESLRQGRNACNALMACSQTPLNTIGAPSQLMIEASSSVEWRERSDNTEHWTPEIDSEAGQEN